jgi:chromosome segregation ATPase
MEKLELSIKKLKKEREEFKKKYDYLASDLKKSVQLFSAHVNRVDSRIKDLEVKLKNVPSRKEMEEIKSKIQKLIDEIESSRVTFESITLLNSRMDEFSLSTKKLNEDLSNLQLLVDRLKREKTDLETIYEFLKKRLDTIKEEADLRGEKIKKLSKDLEAMSIDIEDLKESYKDLSKGYGSDIDERVKKLEDKIRVISNTLENLRISQALIKELEKKFKK